MKNTWLATLAVALVGGTASAQTTTFGAPCTGASGVTPGLDLIGFPVQDAALTLRLTGPGSAAGFLFIGTSNSLWQGIPLPLDLIVANIPGCDLNVGINTAVAFSLPPGGVANVGVTGAPAGLTAYLQTAFVDVGGALQVGMSQGLGVTFQPPLGHVGGELVITEIMKDPDFVDDNNGEWLELLNTTAQDIDIEYFTLSDNRGEITQLDNDGNGIVVPANSYVTIGNEDDLLLNGSVTHIFDYSNVFDLTNGSDEIIITDYEGVEIDRVEYDNGVEWPDTKGASLSLLPPFQDAASNDNPANWLAGICPIGGIPYNDDRGTPGAVNNVCITPPPPTPNGTLVFSEVFQNPEAVEEPVGEWLEVYNPTGVAIDMDGYLISWGAGEIISGSVIVPAGGYALLAGSDDPLENGGLPAVDFAWASDLFLGNGSETLQIYDAALNLVARIHYDNGGDWPDPKGASMSLDPSQLNFFGSQEGTNWCPATTPYGAGDLGTPKAANPSCF